VRDKTVAFVKYIFLVFIGDFWVFNNYLCELILLLIYCFIPFLQYSFGVMDKVYRCILGRKIHTFKAGKRGGGKLYCRVWSSSKAECWLIVRRDASVGVVIKMWEKSNFELQ